MLDPQTKKRVGTSFSGHREKYSHIVYTPAEILIQRVKKLEPEEIARRIKQFDQETCTEVFLSELKGVLPTPEQVKPLVQSHNPSMLIFCQVGKLNVYRNAEPEELAGLHASDRLMVKLIQIERLGPRIQGMLYKCKFEEQWLLLDEVKVYSTIPRHIAEYDARRVLEKLARLVKRCYMLNSSKKCSM